MPTKEIFQGIWLNASGFIGYVLIGLSGSPAFRIASRLILFLWDRINHKPMPFASGIQTAYHGCSWIAFLVSRNRHMHLFFVVAMTTCYTYQDLILWCLDKIFYFIKSCNSVLLADFKMVYLILSIWDSIAQPVFDNGASRALLRCRLSCQGTIDKVK